MLVRILTAASLAALSACGGGAADVDSTAVERPAALRSGRPDEVPVVLSKPLPFRYPAVLYARKIQGNVTLRLFVDTDGRVRPESTRVEETSGHTSLDSAAVMGSQLLQFVPAKLHGEPMGVVVLFPVYFRHPEAAALPGDTLLSVRRP